MLLLHKKVPGTGMVHTYIPGTIILPVPGTPDKKNLVYITLV